MSEYKRISPLLDNFDMGDPISHHDGVRCCPAMERGTNGKYIVKIISIPASRVQLDALLLTGAYKTVADANLYFKDLADQVIQEAEVLKKLSSLEGFLPYDKWQIVPMEDGAGYLVYLLGEYRRTLDQNLKRNPMTHLGAVNLGLDLCAAMTACRHSGYLPVDLKPNNICVIDSNTYRIFDLGFIKLSSLKYASLPEKYFSAYTAPEIKDAFSSLNSTLDIYSAGLILYRVYNGGLLPFTGNRAPEEALPPPAYADYEMAEIILKACSPNPAERWQDPVQMGQAIVSYMQRNGVNDVPIIPIPTADPTPIAVESVPEILAADEATSEEIVEESLIEEIANEASISDEDASDEIADLLAADSEDLPDSAILDSSEAPEDDIIQDIPELMSDESISVHAEEVIVEAESPEDSNNLVVNKEATISSDEAAVLMENSNASEEDLSFLDESDRDETSPEATEDDVPYDDVTNELSEILSYADELLAHPIPDPVIPPEPIEVQIPDPITAEESITPEAPADSNDSPDASEVQTEETTDLFPEPKDISNVPEISNFDETSSATSSIKKWLIAVAVLILIAGLAFAGFYYYQNYYLQPISITTDGTEDSLVVYISSGIDESKLTVLCSDTYGNSLRQPVQNGTAVFSELLPGSGYTISVEVAGFHRLTGNTSTAYSTPVQTNVVQFNAIAGPEDGSVILSFAVDGPDTQQWIVRYTAEGEEVKTKFFTGHMVTVAGLTVGKEYTFTLESESSVFITGNYFLNWLAGKNILAEDLAITACANNTLTAAWNTPDGITVNEWSVRCYNDRGYDETITTGETTIVFQNIDHSQAYTVEVTAENMTVSTRTYIGANPMTVTGYSVDASDPCKLILSWETTHPLSEGNWILLYSADGLDIHEGSCSGENVAVIQPMIPNATYTFTLLTTTGSQVFYNTYEYRTEDAKQFSNYNVTAAHMEFNMCLTPDKPNWDRNDLKPEDYTTTFQIGQKASFLIRVRHEYNPLNENITSLFVIRDKSGNIVKTATSDEAWINMWYRGYCELDIPVMPTAPGDYTITVYFNGYFAGEREFTVTAS